jgi:hypothetical protein
MGTRSMTIVMDENQELCRIYRQMDGYPSGHGLDLAKLCTVKMVNGLSGDKAVANGMGCLAAQIIAGLKDGPGGIYLEPTGGKISDWCEYIYIVRGKEGSFPTIECTTQSGPFPFNVQADKCIWNAISADQITEDFVEKI